MVILFFKFELSISNEGEFLGHDEFQFKNKFFFLHQNNFQKFIALHKFVVVFFHNSSIEESGSAYSVMFDVGDYFAFMTDVDIQGVIIDTESETELCTDQNVNRVPLLRIYTQGEYYDYRKLFNTDDILHFIKSHTHREAIHIHSQEDLARVLKNEFALILYVDSSSGSEEIDEQLDIYNKVLTYYRDLHFYYIFTSDFEVVWTDQWTKFNLVAHREFEDGNKILSKNSTISEAEIIKWIADYQYPVVRELSNEIMRLVFKKKKDAVFIFYRDGLTLEMRTFNEVARNYSSKILFVKVNFNSTQGERLINYFGIKSNQDHSVKILEYQNDEIRRYKLKKWDENSLRQFLDQFFIGKLDPYFLSAKIPENYEGIVKTVVGKTVDKMILKSPDNVLLLAYMKDDSRSLLFLEAFEEYMAKLEHALGQSFIAMKYEGTRNNHYGLKIKGYPSVILYKKNEKDSPKYYNRDLFFTHLVRFLEHHLGTSLRYPGDEKEIPIDGSL